MSFLGPVEEHQIEEVAAGLAVSPGDVVRRMIEAAFSPEKEKRLFLEVLPIYRNNIAFHNSGRLYLHASLEKAKQGEQPLGAAAEFSFWEHLQNMSEVPFADTLRDYILHGLTAGEYWQKVIELSHADLRAAKDEETEARPFYETATPEEWLAAFTEWTESHRGLPCIPASAFSREADYEDRL